MVRVLLVGLGWSAGVQCWPTPTALNSLTHPMTHPMTRSMTHPMTRPPLQVLLVAELELLVANPDRLAKGTVLEASLDKKSGPIATLLVQAGTLRVGDIVAAGSAIGKVRPGWGRRGGVGAGVRGRRGGSSCF